jgi:hypothetical protein
MLWLRKSGEGSRDLHVSAVTSHNGRSTAGRRFPACPIRGYMPRTNGANRWDYSQLWVSLQLAGPWETTINNGVTELVVSGSGVEWLVSDRVQVQVYSRWETAAQEFSVQIQMSGVEWSEWVSNNQLRVNNSSRRIQEVSLWGIYMWIEDLIYG